MNLIIEIDDWASPLMKEIILNNKRNIRSALKSAGWRAQQQTKAGIRSGAPGGKAYKPLIPTDVRRLFDTAFGNKIKRRYPVMGQLVNAVGYDSKTVGEGYVTVGFLSASAVNIAQKQASGFDTPVTESVQKALMAVGIKMNAGGVIHVSARPTMAPMYDVLVPEINTWFRDKILSYLGGNKERSQRSTNRSYRVYK